MSNATSSGNAQLDDPHAESRFSAPVGTPYKRRQRNRNEDLSPQSPADRVISKPEDLSAKEMDAPMDLVEEWMLTRPVPDENDIRIPKMLLDSFKLRIFESWSSHQIDNPAPKLRPRKSDETSIRVGTLTQNQPPAKKRKADATTPETRPCRMAGADVFLSPTLQYEEDNILWMWRDAEGRLVNWQHIQLNPGLDQGTAKVKAIRQYDNAERLRVTGYNTRLAISLARRRIVSFAQRAGSQENPVIRPEDAAVGFEPLELCQDVADGMFADARQILEAVRKTGFNGPSLVM